MKYSVVIGTMDEQLIGKDLSLTAAKKLAKKTAKDQGPFCPDDELTDNAVYIKWFRTSDGQHGYVSRGEGHTLSGKPWND